MSQADLSYISTNFLTTFNLIGVIFSPAARRASCALRISLVVSFFFSPSMNTGVILEIDTTVFRVCLSPSVRLATLLLSEVLREEIFFPFDAPGSD